MSTNNLRSVAFEAVSSLIKHYSDPVHFSTTDDNITDDISSNDAEYVCNNDKPYFATSLVDKPMPNLAPVCEFWYKKLADNNSMNTSCDHKTQSSLDVARELICCYESTIHPLVIQRHKPLEDNKTSSGIIKEVVDNKAPLNAVIEVVKQYELLLAHLRDAAYTKLSVEDEMNNQSSNMVGVTSSSNTVSSTNAMIVELGADDEGMPKASAEGSNICRLVHIIAEDIFHLSTKLPTNNTSLWKVQNILFPCLLRIIQHSIVLLDSYQHNNSSSSLSKDIKEAYAIATIAAVPFVGDGKVNSGVFGIGSSLEWVSNKEDDGTSIPPELSLAYTLQECVPSPVSKEKESSNNLPSSIMSSNFMTRSVVDWSVKAAQFDAPWVSSLLVFTCAVHFLLDLLTKSFLFED